MIAQRLRYRRGMVEAYIAPILRVDAQDAPPVDAKDVHAEERRQDYGLRQVLLPSRRLR